MSIYRGIALTIAGSDSGGGAGIEADLKTCAALRVFGTVALTAVTVQNSLGVHGVHDIPPEIVYAQMKDVLTDFPVGASKTGMLSRPETIHAVCRGIRDFGIKKLVVDPVMIAQSGDSLICDEAVAVLREELLPLATLITPNIPEAVRLSGIAIETVDDMERAGLAIAKNGTAVLVKGGHMEKGETITDVLCIGDKAVRFSGSRIHTSNNHGTGCTLSSAITAELAAGSDLETAVFRGRSYLRLALENSFKPGHGYGPTGHAVRPDWIEPY